MTPTGLISWIGWVRCSQKPEEIFQPGKQEAFLLLGGQGIGVNNGGSCPKAQYLAAVCQYECSVWRASSIRKRIFTDG